MIEAFRRITGSSEIYQLKKFAPVTELERIIEDVPSENVDSYLSHEFRDLLKRYGEDFSYPIGLRSISRPFKEDLQRRAAIMIASDSLHARLLVVETDRFKNSYPGGPSPRDSDTSDITIWPMRIRRGRPSENPWHIDGDQIPSAYDTEFTISLKKIGNHEFVEARVSRVNYNYRVWAREYNVNAVNLIKYFGGLR